MCGTNDKGSQDQGENPVGWVLRALAFQTVTFPVANECVKKFLA